MSFGYSGNQEAQGGNDEETPVVHLAQRLEEILHLNQEVQELPLAADTKQLDMEETAETAAAAAYNPVALANQKLTANGKNIAQQNANETIAKLAQQSVQQQIELLGKLAGQSPLAKQAYMMAKKNPPQTTTLFSQMINMNTQQIQKLKEAEEAAAAAASASASASSSYAAIQLKAALFGNSNGMTPQQLQQMRALTPAQQRALLDAVRQQAHQQKK